MREYDVFVVGGGPAGLTAALYASRSKLDTICAEKNIFGGRLALTNNIENYPGFPGGIDGEILSGYMKEQAGLYGTMFLEDEVKDIEQAGDLFSVRTGQESFTAKTVILAMGVVASTGSSPQKLGCEGEEELLSRGVSYCATCDGAFFENSRVAVVGGNEEALEEADFLTKYASVITIIHDKDRFDASGPIVERAVSNPKIETRMNCTVKRIYGEELVEGLVFLNNLTGEEEDLPLEGVFIYAGKKPGTAFLGGSIQVDSKGYITTDEDMRTNAPGVFAAGDTRSKTLRQVCTAAADGAIAATQARKYIAERF